MNKTVTLKVSIERGDPYLLEKLVRTWLTTDAQFALFGGTGLDMEYEEIENAPDICEGRKWAHEDWRDFDKTLTPFEEKG